MANRLHCTSFDYDCICEDKEMLKKTPVKIILKMIYET